MRFYHSANEILKLAWEKNPRGLRDKPGVYMIKDKESGEFLYVGQSVRVGYRLTPSQHPFIDHNLHDVYYLYELSKNERWYIEMNAILLLKPKMNKRIGLLPKVYESILDDAYSHVFNQE